MQSAEVIGVVSSVKERTSYQEPTLFKVYCTGIKKTFDVVCDMFCPVRQGDTIQMFCLISPDGKFHVIRQPFVQPFHDKDNIIQCLMKTLKKGYSPCVKLFNKFSKKAGGEDLVIPYLSEKAQEWEDKHDVDILCEYEEIEPETMKKLLGWWHKERNVRRLYLLGLTKKEINACRMTCEQIYQKCTNNPFTLPAIPLDKCESILERLGKPLDADAKLRGSIVRMIWKNLHEAGWTGYPNRYLLKQFPEVKHHMEALENDYGVVNELETVYLKFPNKVERFVANFIIERVEEDVITYHMPLDEKITLKNGRTIERLSAHFTKNMSEDQKKAVQGALDHKLCVVTGGAGVGKCLNPGTPVLMFDGSIKKIEDIKVGEKVMGPDSKPRNVLSVCSGEDEMFEIIPSSGRSFVCNEPHVLTLKGIQPYIVQNRVVYSEKGIQKSKYFSTKEEAKTFLNSLGEDIFDIFLNEYLLREKSEHCYLYHVGVEFPEEDVPIHPYIFGYSLGDSGKNGMKYIPELYKINSRRIRLAVLAGLLDSDDISDEMKGYLEITKKNKRLSDDIEYLAFSLGFMVTRSENKMIIFGEGLEKIPTIIPRRKSSLGKRATCLRFEVKAKGRGEYFGFELDGDGRFLLGDFLVTHNTTVLEQIIHNLELRKVNYAAIAFTGKAVSRIREVTKRRTPSTIHRLIANTKRIKEDKRSNQFEKDIPLCEYEHVIIDEASMVTTELFHRFLEAYPNVDNITLVGDVNQLQPIGWGSLFKEIMQSETVPTYELTTNFRVLTKEGEKDGIISNANAIINHDPEYPFEFFQTSNFSVIEGPEERVYDILKECKSKGVKVEQLVILSPFNKSLDTLNRTFQEIYNPDSKSVRDSRGVKWTVGDRVMLTENDGDIGVFNGESGIVKEVEDEFITVEFPGSGCHDFPLEPCCDRTNFEFGTSAEGIYRRKKVEQVLDGDEGEDSERTVKKLSLAYAITVDKSQGSEWDFVIFYIPEFNCGSFLNKNRIYTGLTRAKKCVWAVVTDADAFNETAIKAPPYRCENLARRISAELPTLKPFKLDLKEMTKFVKST